MGDRYGDDIDHNIIFFQLGGGMKILCIDEEDKCGCGDNTTNILPR